MPLVVTGLSQTGNLGVLHKVLETAGLATDCLQVIGPDDAPGRMSRGLAGAELLTHEGGTGVPGINNARRPSSFFNDGDSLSSRLGDLEIPDSELDNYVEALERGRSVVAYYAHASTIDKVEAAFREAQLMNVRRF